MFLSFNKPTVVMLAKSEPYPNKPDSKLIINICTYNVPMKTLSLITILYLEKKKSTKNL